MAQNTLYWYDFETFGNDPRRDRASQFAGIRTDEELNIIGEPLVIYCQPVDDFLPSPMACHITGITPQYALAKGLREADFIAAIHEEFSQANTCVSGYNSIRFDDEMTRQLLYRNFYDPYEREWKNGNSRWDIIDMMRLCAAIRPQGINWPKREDGSHSFRLDQLTVANGIEHGAAHDALADVIATIEMAKLVRKHQPKLYSYLYDLRLKHKVQQQIDIPNQTPIVHVSMMYPASQGCLSVVAPVCQHPVNKNGVIAYDLRDDPEQWLDLEVDEIKRRIFTAQDDLSEEVSRIGLKTIHVNKCPVVAPVSVMSQEQFAAYAIDMTQCNEHHRRLRAYRGVKEKLAQVFAKEMDQTEEDCDYAIYSGGFFSQADKVQQQTIRESPIALLRDIKPSFNDKRLGEMFFRYKARNYPESLNTDELAEWQQFKRARLADEDALARYQVDLAQALQLAVTDKEKAVLADLTEYVDSIKAC